jgi:hypothetical protein
MKAHHFLIAAAAVAAAGAAGAQTLKPGLWEVTNKTQTGAGRMQPQMAEMQKQMAAMPPEQRKMMEEMLARRGAKLGAGGEMTVKVCMTREMVERSEMPVQQGDCKTTHQSRSGNTMKMGFACANPPSSGEGQMVFSSPEAYSSKLAITTTVQGRPEKVDMESSGKWVGADCGSVKPMMAPPKK